uniref:Titin n=1 Tax=Coturnix japonica TaxID=93934 RepID=A0A8C2U3D0_COTJA
MNSEGLGEPALVPGTPKAEERLLPPEIELDAELRKVVTIRACCTLRLFVPIKGRPAPEVKWTREHGESLDRATIESTSSYTLLIVENVNRFDSGKYMLTIENSSGSKSAFVNVRVLDTPGPPQDLKIKEVTKSSVTLTWEPPLLDGGSKIKNYIVEKRESTRKGKSDPRALAVPVVAKDLVIEPDVRPAFHSYSIQVGQDLKVEVPVSGRPKPTVTWVKDGQTLRQTTRVNVSDLTDLTVLNIKETSKEDGGTYEITVANVVGQKSASVEIITLDKPDPPYKDTIVVNAGDTFRLEADVHGKPLPTIKWYKGDKELEETARYEIKNTDFSALIIVKDAIRVDGGQYILEASNVAGTKTVPVNVKVLDRPGPPEGPVQVTGVTAEKCSLAWSPPLHDGGSDISHYIVEKRETSRLAWTVVASEVLPTMLKVTKLLEGNEYIFRIMAVNKYGVGEPLESVPVMMKNPFVVPSPPKALEITNITKDSMTVCWSRPDSDGGSEIIGYVVEKRDRAGIRWIKCNKRRITDLRLRVTGLTEDHEYEFRVSAENAAGLGEPSQVSPYFKACDPMFKPGPPTNAHVVDTTKSSVTLSWSKPIYDGGSEIQGYLVEICKADEDEWSLVTPQTGIRATRFEIKKLTEHQEYKLRVCALNKVGVGEAASVPGTIKPEDKLESKLFCVCLFFFLFLFFKVHLKLMCHQNIQK